MQYQLLKKCLALDAAGKWLVRDSQDDFFPDALNFADVEATLTEYLAQRQHRVLQIDSLPHLVDEVPKASGMIRESVWLHPTHRILYLACLHYLLPKLDHQLPSDVYSYRRDGDDQDAYPFPQKMERWKYFRNDFRQGCIDESTSAVLITDIASYYDHIHVDALCERITIILGDRATPEDLAVVECLGKLLRQWSTGGYGIPQNLDASSFFGSLFLSGADREMLDKRYRYFRYVDDIRVCAVNRKQALRALHDLQRALSRYRMFLASDKTFIIEKGTGAFDTLVDVTDDTHLSRIEDAVATGQRETLEAEIPKAKARLEFHAGQNGDDRRFRAFMNRLLQIAEYEELKEHVHGEIGPFIVGRLSSHPQRSDQWTRALQEIGHSVWMPEVIKLLKD